MSGAGEALDFEALMVALAAAFDAEDLESAEQLIEAHASSVQAQASSLPLDGPDTRAQLLSLQRQQVQLTEYVRARRDDISSLLLGIQQGRQARKAYGDPVE